MKERCCVQRLPTMKLPLFILTILLLLPMAILHAAIIPAKPVAEKPNVLLLIADDFRDTGGVFTKALAKTPNLDRLAARGVRFTNAFAQYPVCNPSRTSLLTGLRCEQTGIV